MTGGDVRRGFSLLPFGDEEVARGTRITGTVSRRGTILTVKFALLGNLSEIEIPPREEPPGRRDRLWEETCLEVFLAEKGAERYWEFNLSPAGHWNVYRFASYRREMQEEKAFASLPLRVRREPGRLRLSLELATEKILPVGREIEVALGAVIKPRNGGTSHWALVHPGIQPDFHRRDGFALSLPAG